MVTRNCRSLLMLLFLGTVTSLPAAGGSAVIGLVAGSTSATLGGKPLFPNTTVFSGDRILVQQGVAVVALGGSSRMVFGRETEASFLREASEVTVLLSHGNVSLYHPDDAVALRVKAGEISITPVAGFKALGDVAMVNGAVVVTSKQGRFRVEGNGPAMEVVQGKTLTVPPKTAHAAPKSPPVLNAPGAGVNMALQVGSLASSGLSAVLSGVAISRANGAKDAATAATQAASQADNDAKAATAAANAAAAAANGASSNANAVGCALNVVAASLGATVSPYTPPSGFPPC